MKYALLIYNNVARWEALSKEAQDEEIGAHFALIDSLRQSGEWVSLIALANEAKVVRDAVGMAAVTDGPFGEAKELLASVWVVDCETEDRALAIAGPIARYTPVEVRALMHTGGMEM